MPRPSAIGAIASSYLKQVPPASQLLYANVMDGGGRRSYDGRAGPVYGDTIYNPWNGANVPGYDLQFQVSIGWETNGIDHILELTLGNVGYSSPKIITIHGAGDVGNGVTQISPWTTLSQSL